MKATYLLILFLTAGCASSNYTKNKDGIWVYKNNERMPMEVGDASTPYPVFVPPLAGVQPDIVSGPVKRPTNSYPVYIPTVPGTQGLAPLYNSVPPMQ
jgi:hypothetical protein